ncbi:restriction endonuclease subunit S [Acinetobacter terrestris]|uniref:restriction endonuclease subunit S n=1 Tax=Acinetobacter terrestris TaxID=2529843 RepID=UPI00103E0676|nr:restriction endonuclease subunit S [Acinetobacter terrestris]TCB45155.1 restriction endonuclease subunit S [Acinetobacter terrestris]
MAKYQKYAEYKDSGVEWLGEIPRHWDLKPIKYLFGIINGSTPKSGEEAFWDGEITWITPSDLSKLRSHVIGESIRTITKKGLDSCGTSLVPSDTIILSCRAPIGSLAVTSKEACTNQGCKSLVKKYDLSTKFFYYYLSISTKQLNNLGRGTTFLELSSDELGSYALGIPNAEEQTQIANFLDHETAKIDTLIAKQEKLIELLKEKRQAVISHAVTKGLNPDVNMKDSGVEWLGQVPEHWQLVPLKYLCTFSGGGTPTKDNLSYWTDGNIPWVSPKDMKTFWISETQDYITEKAVKESSTNIVEQNSLLMVVRSGILQRTIPIAINTVPVTMNQDMKALKFGKRVLVEYIANLIHGNTAQLLLEWSKEGATVESIEHEYLANSLIPVPSLKEQEEITQVIAKKMKVYAELTEKAELQITLLQERRTALISSAVTGKINVTNWQHPNKNNEATTELGA